VLKLFLGGTRVSPRPRFDLVETLLWCVACVAFAYALTVRFGLVGLMCAVCLSAVPVGVVSVHAQRTTHFLQCLGSFVILAYFCFPSTSHSPSEISIIITACVHGAGTMLALSAIRRGHWSTKLLACVAFAAYLGILGNAIYLSVRKWDAVVDYWRL
jgi:hypothetical protein